MLYPDNIEDKIDFTSIRELLKQHCSFALGREMVDDIAFLTDYDTLSRLLGESQEMRHILEDASLAFPSCDMHDLRDSLSRIRIEGLFLDEDELSYLRKALDAVLQYQDFFRILPEERFPLLHGLSPEPLPIADDSVTPEEVPFRDILREIDRILDKYGRLKDNASPELARIRRELTLSQGSVNRALNAILRQAQSDGLLDKDVTPTLREGRLVIPVPPAYKRKIGGIVHDESATGKTVYIEPQQVVEANNRIRELEGDERRERTRILQAFATYLRPYAPGIKNSQFYLGRIDFIRAKAMLARELNAIAPEMLPAPYFDIREARHPILYLNFLKQHREVVPLSLRLRTGASNPSNISEPSTPSTPAERILVISGPNAGGKSVCLKTVALLQYMLQCGIPVPVREDSKMGIFNNLFIDIGDEQSIEDDLSTYSSHLRNMKHFVRYSNAQTLFLIDEFGGGTEPLLGGAIAESILQRLNDNEAFGVITTHYTNLKHFAENHEGVINGAMLYDRGALRPLFQLSIGQPGSSFAIEIARQIGLPEEIILAAKELVGEDNIQYDRHLQDIARDKRYWAEKRKQVHDKEKQLTALTEKYESEMAEIRQKRKEVLTKAREEAADILQQSNRTIENTIRTIKESAADKEKTREARLKVEHLKDNLSRQLEKASAQNAGNAGNSPSGSSANGRQSGASKNQDQQPNRRSLSPKQGERDGEKGLSVGCKVRIRGQQTVGEIVSMTEKQATVAFGNLKSQIPLKKLEYVSNSQAKKAQTHSALSSSQAAIYSSISDAMRKKKLAFHDEIDLRGMRADEALQEVMNYIDDAIMVGAVEVRILHGTGTGALKQVVRDYLHQQHRVVSYHDGDPDKGGAGITVVEF